MKKIFLLICIVASATFIASCNNKKSNTAETAAAQSGEAEADSTIYGTCGEGTSMNSLQLIGDKGDTLTFTLQDADGESDVQGGLLAGDRLAVVACKNQDGEMFAQKVINLTSLQGKWTSIDRAFTILDGGVVEGDKQEVKTYVDWRIMNGKLILTSDTFSVYSLGPDSLLLENDKGIYAYKRVMK